MVSNHMFQVKRVVSAGPNRDGLRHTLKTSELGTGVTKRPRVWADQTRDPNLHPVSMKCARETHKGKKKSEENSRIVWRHFRKPKMQAGFDPNHKTCVAITALWDAAAQPGVNDTWGFTTPTWTNCLQAWGRCMLRTLALDS